MLSSKSDFRPDLYINDVQNDFDELKRICKSYRAAELVAIRNKILEAKTSVSAQEGQGFFVSNGARMGRTHAKLSTNLVVQNRFLFAFGVYGR